MPTWSRIISIYYNYASLGEVSAKYMPRNECKQLSKCMLILTRASNIYMSLFKIVIVLSQCASTSLVLANSVLKNMHILEIDMCILLEPLR